MRMSSETVAVHLVHACLRDGRGGSPTAVLADPGWDDGVRRRLPARLGTSHAVFVSTPPEGPIALRFFTETGELPACGHGTVAALAFLAAQSDSDAPHLQLATPAGVLVGDVSRRPDHLTTGFDAGSPTVRKATAEEQAVALGALHPGIDATNVSVASNGRERLLVPVASRAALAALTPDLERLRAGCEALGLLGCYVYSPPAPDGRLAARMFAPAIGVPEDVANANSTACLAALLARDGFGEITADMGDALGHAATITARAARGGTHTRVRIEATAAVGETRRVSPIDD